jgi:uncharacterized protein (TIGR01777 family)
MRIFVLGGTGLIGRRLLPRLRQRQAGVVVLTRRPAAAVERLGPDCTIVAGDGMTAGPWMDRLAECDAVISLVGESIFARRWDEPFKALLHDSRIKTTQNVVQALARNPRTADGRPKVLVNASAVGYYGPCGDEELTEDGPPGNDTLGRLAADWEKAAREAEPLGVRLALARIGVVLDKEEGALTRMLPFFKMGMGGPIGSGKQWMSWVHYEDVVGILLLALDDAAAAGPLNATAPNPVTSKQFAKALGRALHRPAFLPVPAFALRLKFGEVADVLTTGQRVLPVRALALGYRFKFPDLDAALRDLFA